MHLQTVPLDDLHTNLKLPKLGEALTPDEGMRLAWKLAWQGTGYVKSNPLVGAVCLDKNKQFVAGAWHLGFGKAHAEQALIKKIYEQGQEELLQEATIYVTLEPCAHIGKTPSCAQLMSDLPIKKVVYGLSDPTKKTSGKGPALLQQSGIRVEQFRSSPEVLQQLKLLVEHFYSYEVNKQTFVSAKIASTINGIYSYSGAKRAWITGKRARAYGHWLRLYHDAIIVGADTVIQDNPSLTIRAFEGGRTPLRIVVDPFARALKSRSIAKQHLLTGEAAKTLWCVKRESLDALDSAVRRELESLGLRFFLLEESEKESIFAEIHAFLFAQGIASVLIEGGAGVWASAFNGNKVDKLYLFQAPKVLSHEQIMPWAQGFKHDVSYLDNVILTRLDEDLLIEGYTRDSLISL